MPLFTKINSPQALIDAHWIPARFLNKLGYIADEPNDKDWLFSASPMANNNVGEDVDLRKWFRPISNQLSLSSCVANATADAFEAQLAHKKNVDPSQIKDISRLFIYFCARNNENPPAGNIDNGTRIRLAFDAMSRYGSCSEDTYPYKIENVNIRPSIIAFREAIANRINAFYRIDGTGTDRIVQMKQALQAGNPVVFGTQLSDPFRSVNSEEPIQPPTSGFIGGHAMVAVGYSSAKQSFIVRNSWGEDWNSIMKGYCYFSENYFTADITRDLWVPTI